MQTPILAKKRPEKNKASGEELHKRSLFGENLGDGEVPVDR